MNNRAEALQIHNFEIEKMSGTKVPAYKKTPNEWLERWFHLNKVTFNYDGNHTILDAYTDKIKIITSSELHNFIFIGTGVIGEKTIRPIIQPYIDSWMFREKQKVKNTLINKVLFCEEESDMSHITSFIKALTGNEDPVDIAVIYNFIASVKKKMTEQEVDIDLFPVLKGIQNTGKSTAVRKLLTPISRFWTDRSLDFLNQEKNLKVLSQKYVIWFDEMARAKRADVDAVKKHTTDLPLV